MYIVHYVWLSTSAYVIVCIVYTRLTALAYGSEQTWVLEIWRALLELTLFTFGPSLNAVTWSPYTLQDIEAVERVQRRFTKRFSGLNKLSYQERLKIPRPAQPRITSITYWFNLVIQNWFWAHWLQFEDFFSNWVPTLTLEVTESD